MGTNEWSEWEEQMDDAGLHYLRYKYNEHGEPEFQYNYPDDQAIPKQFPGHDEELGPLADELSNVSLNDDPSYYGGYTTGTGDTHGYSAYHKEPQSAPKGKGKAVDTGKHKQPSRSHKDQAKEKSSHKSKGRDKKSSKSQSNAPNAQYTQELDPFYYPTTLPQAAANPQEEEAGIEQAQALEPGAGDSAQLHDDRLETLPPQEEFAALDDTYYTGGAFDGAFHDESFPAAPRPQVSTLPKHDNQRKKGGHAVSQPRVRPQQAAMNYEDAHSLGFEDEEAGGDDLAAFMEEAKGQYLDGHGRDGEASTEDLDGPYGYAPPMEDDGLGDDGLGDDGMRTPRAATPDPQYSQELPVPQMGNFEIKGNLETGFMEQLDPRYEVAPSHRFAPGEVFKILWSEPLGQGKTEARANITAMTDHEIRTSYGQKFYVGFRRFIVVANDEGHCTCVPILTYERRGCTKRGVKPNKHGLVCQFGQKPKLLPGEPSLGFDPVRLELDVRGEKLARESRVNYSKLVTVEHNVKVFFIGRVIRDDFEDIVGPAVDQCWLDKTRKKTGGGSKKAAAR